MPPNNNNNNNNNSAQVKDAQRNLKELERRVSKLGDLSNQGKFRQDGFLSKKQVELYKNIMKEIKQVQDDYLRRLDYFNKEVDKRQKQFNDAQIRGARTHAQFYQGKLKQATAGQAATQGMVGQIGGQVNMANQYANNINQMHQLGPRGRQMLYGVGNALQHTGMVVSAGGLLRYGIQGIRANVAAEEDASRFGMKTGYAGAFGRTVRDLQTTGIANGFKGQETRQVGSILVGSQGFSGDRDKLFNDVNTVQSFSRGYGTDANETAAQMGIMGQMGSVDEGGQRRFADMIAGAIARGGMSGREEEALRSTVTLANQVGSTLTKFTETQTGTVSAYQSLLSQAIPTLKGDRGAALLGNIDSSIKGGGNNMDILLGKGTKYTGVAGMWQLQLQKEKGLGDASNMQTIIQNLTKGIPNINSRKFAMSENLGLTANQVEDLYSSGMVDKFMGGEQVTQEEINKILGTGEKDAADKAGQYGDSNIGQYNKAQATLERTKTDATRPAQHGITKLLSAFTGQPEWAQMSEIFGAGVGMTLGGGLLRRGTTSLFRAVMPPIGRGLGGGLGGLLRGTGGLISGAANGLARGSSSALGGLARGSSSLLGGLGKALPFLGKAAGVGGAAYGAYEWGKNFDNFMDNNNMSFGKTANATMNALGDDSGWGGAMHQLGSKKYWSGMWNQATSKDTWGALLGFGSSSKKLEAPASSEQQSFNDQIAKNLEIAKQLKNGTIKIDVSGKIDGMNAENQGKVANSFQSYFNNVFNQKFGIDLSLDQKRY